MPILNHPAAPGGGSIPQTRSTYGTTTTTIANNAGASLPWGTQFGDVLLDLTTPAAPTIVTAGVYAVSVSVSPSPMTAGGTYNLDLELDTAGADPAVVISASQASAGNTAPALSATLVYYVPAGGVLRAFVGNQDGALSIDFAMSASIQRLS